MGSLVRDLRYAARVLRAAPGFTFAAVLTLAIGIGSTVAIFSIVDTVVLRPLPFARPDQLIAVTPARDAPGRLQTVSLEELHDWRQQSRTIAAFAGWRDWGMTRHEGGDVSRAYAVIVTPDLFRVLPVTPVLGRVFAPDDDRPGQNRVVLLCHDYWRQRFGGDPNVIGRELDLERRDRGRYIVAGVLPREFNATPSFADVDLVALSSTDSDALTGRRTRNRRVFARLADGATIEDARAEMTVIAARLARQFPDTNRDVRVEVTPLAEHEIGPIGGTLGAFFAAVEFVLLIACANVAGLQLARAIARRREFSIRQALGGSRLAIGRALAAESALVSLLGGAAALFIARWLVDVVIATGPAIPRAESVTFGWTVFVFAFAICAGAALLLALPVSILTTRIDLARALKDESGQVTGARGLRTRMTFVAAQVAIAVVLLAGATLAGQTLARQLTLKPGFDPEGLAAMSIFASTEKYRGGGEIAALYARVLAEIRALPGVGGASAVSAHPLSGEGAEPAEFRLPDGDTPVVANSFNVAPGYFRTLGTPVVRGRDLLPTDVPAAPMVAVVNEAFVRRYLRDRDPLGVRLRIEASGEIVSIVGVAGDLLQALSPRASAEPEIYWPYAQRPRWATFVVVRGDAAGAVMADVRRRILAIDPDLRLGAPRLMTDRIARSARAPRFVLLLFGAFATVALILSATGIYGLVSYAFAQRTREIGVRVSLGAGPREILRLVASSGVAAVLAGSAIGVAGAVALARPLGALVPDLDPVRPLAMASTWMLLVAVGCLACYLPARRALRMDPVTALRVP